MTVEVEVDSSVLDNQVWEYGSELARIIDVNFPTPPAGITYENMAWAVDFE